ncbi:MAG: hypothetical protein WA432_00170 [Candidatus Babeliaceae bacterium]
MIREFADIFEAIDALSALHNVSRDEIIAAQIKKHVDRGGFSGRKFVEKAEHPEGSFGTEYCLADPEKYPEITQK